MYRTSFTRFALVLTAALSVGSVALGASVSSLLDGKDALQCYRTSGSKIVRCRNLRTGEDWKVFTSASDPTWMGAINRDGTKLTTVENKRIVVVNLDGSHKRTLTSSDTDNASFWRDSSGRDWVIYNGELGSKYSLNGSTWRVRIDPVTNQPEESTREKILNKHFDSGMTGDGRYVGRTYAESRLYDLQSGVMSPHLNGSQNCVASVNPGDKPWMMYEKEPAHHDVVISEWRRSDNSARYIWQYHYGSGEVFGLWSCSDNRYAMMRKGSQLYLVKLQVDTSGSGNNTGSYQEAGTGVPNYVGRLWVGTLDATNDPPSASIATPANGATYTAGDTLSYSGSASDPEDGALSAGSLAWSIDRSGDGLGAVHTSTGGSGSYTLPGDLTTDTTYTVTLTATDSDGASDSVTRAVTVSPAPPPDTPPTATIATPADGATYTAGATLSYSGSGSDAEDGTLSGGSLAWSIDRSGDGQGAVHTSTGTSGSYALPADLAAVTTYTIRLTATDSDGNTDDDTHTITVNPATPSNDPPTASIAAPADGATYTAGDTLSYTGGASDPEDGALSGGNLVWEIDRSGDGQGAVHTSTGAAGSYVLPADLTVDTVYTVKLVATDSGGATHSVIHTVTASPAPPADTPCVVSFTTPADGATVVGTVGVNATGHDADAGSADGDGIASVLFELLDGATVVASHQENVVTYDWSVDTTAHANGSYVLRATASSTPAAGGGSSQAQVTIVIDNPLPQRDADDPADTVAGLDVDYYELTDPQVLPDFASMSPYASDVVTALDFPTTSAAFATSGRADDVGAVFSGYVSVPADGTYAFYTESDDGSALYIGSTLVVDNDGKHAMEEQSGTIGLKAGMHALRVEFFEAQYGAGLHVRYEGPGIAKTVIPSSALLRVPSSPTVPDVVITSPASGEVWYVGTTRRIVWDTTLDDCAIYYNVDGGAWQSVNASIDVTSPHWLDLPWLVPDAPSTACRILISGYFGESPTESGVFEIRAVTDADGDGMDDGWETAHFGDTSRDGADDADGDGLTDLDEFMNGTDPGVADASDGVLDTVAFSCAAGAGAGAWPAALLLCLLAATLARAARPRHTPRICPAARRSRCGGAA